MKFTAIILGLLLSITAFAAPLEKVDVPAKTKTITLTSLNHVVLDGYVGGKRFFTALHQLLKLDSELAEGLPIYVVLNSGGGSVWAGLDFLNALKSINRPIYAIPLYAASMAFAITQGLEKRYVTNNSVLMQHRATIWLWGEMEGELKSRLEFFTRMIDFNERKTAKRLGLTFDEFKAKIADEWWIYGPDSVNAKVADEVINVRCSKDLFKIEKEQFTWWRYKITIERSKCPLVTGLMKFDVKDKDEDKKTTKESKKRVRLFFTSPSEYYSKYELKDLFKQ